MNYKKCSKCKEEKDIIEFNKSKNRLNSWCKKCVRLRSKKHYEENKIILLDRRKIYLIERRKWFDDYKKTLSCLHCGENHESCLDFHHLDPTKKDFTISQAISRDNKSKENILKEIQKCIVLCSNCHRKMHYDFNKKLST